MYYLQLVCSARLKIYRGGGGNVERFLDYALACAIGVLLAWLLLVALS